MRSTSPLGLVASRQSLVIYLGSRTSLPAVSVSVYHYIVRGNVDSCVTLTYGLIRVLCSVDRVDSSRGVGKEVRVYPQPERIYRPGSSFCQRFWKSSLLINVIPFGICLLTWQYTPGKCRAWSNLLGRVYSIDVSIRVRHEDAGY